MAKKEATQDLVYIQLLGKLRKLINTEYKDGGRFPSSRDICDRMGVNRNTYIKALSRLVADGYVRNYHQRGVYVTPDRFRCHKIGVVIGNGQDSPFFYNANNVAKIFTEITRANYDVQQIQAASPQQIYRKAILHGANSLLWIYSQPAHLEIAREIIKKGDLPIVMLQCYDSSNNSILDDNFPHVSIDYQELGRRRARYFIEKNHKSIAYIGKSDFGEYISFFDELKSAGIKVNDTVQMAGVDQLQSRFLDYMKTENVTAVYSEGPTELMHCVLELISDSYHKSSSPEVILRSHKFANEVVNDFPELKDKIGIEYCETETASFAVEMLVQYLRNGTPLHSIKVPLNYKIKI